MSPAASAEVGVDPDVFTDALVLSPAWLEPRCFDFPSSVSSLHFELTEVSRKTFAR
jgi:hypothetical protein